MKQHKIRELTSTADVEKLFELCHQKKVFILKHSPRCHYCDLAMEMIEQFAADHPELECVYVDVLAHRDVSNFIANETQLPHQSPQILLLSDGKVIWDEEQTGITREAVEAQVT